MKIDLIGQKAYEEKLTTTTTTKAALDVRAWVYYKPSLLAWRLRLANI